MLGLGWSVVEVSVILATSFFDFFNSEEPADVSFRFTVPVAPAGTENLPEATVTVFLPFLPVSTIVPAAFSTLSSLIVSVAFLPATVPLPATTIFPSFGVVNDPEELT